MEDGDTGGDNHSDRDSDKFGNGKLYVMMPDHAQTCSRNSCKFFFVIPRPLLVKGTGFNV